MERETAESVDYLVANQAKLLLTSFCNLHYLTNHKPNASDKRKLQFSKYVWKTSLLIESPTMNSMHMDSIPIKKCLKDLPPCDRLSESRRLLDYENAFDSQCK